MNLKDTMTTEESSGRVPAGGVNTDGKNDSVNETIRSLSPTPTSPERLSPPNVEGTASQSDDVTSENLCDNEPPASAAVTNGEVNSVHDNVGAAQPGDEGGAAAAGDKRPTDGANCLKNDDPSEPRSNLHPGVSLLDKSPKKSSLKRKNTEEDDGTKPKKRKTITFNEINVYYFPRAQGFTCVPSQGGSTLGMASHHTHVERFTLSEHAAEQKRAHRNLLIQQRQQRQLIRMQQGAQKLGSGSSSEDSQTDEDEGSDYSDSEIDLDNYYFLQPVPTRQRRAMLRASGIRKIESIEKDECRSIRSSREFCGCQCKVYCDPDTCSCAQAGIKCQVDRLNFPCGCTRDGCKNSNGRIEFNPLRVRTHFIHTLMRLELERKRDQSGWREAAPEPTANWLNMGLGGGGMTHSSASGPGAAPITVHQYPQHGMYFGSTQEVPFLKHKSERHSQYPVSTHIPPVGSSGSCTTSSASSYRGGHYDNGLDQPHVARSMPHEDTQLDLYGAFQEDSFSDNSEEFSNDSYDSQVQNHFSESQPNAAAPLYNNFDINNFQLHSHYPHGFGASHCPDYSSIPQPYQQLNTDIKYPPINRNYLVNPGFCSAPYSTSYDISTNFSNQFQHEAEEPGHQMNGFVSVANGSAISSCDTLNMAESDSITNFPAGSDQSYTNLSTVSSLSKISSYTDLLPLNSSFSCLHEGDPAYTRAANCNNVIHDAANNGELTNGAEPSHLLGESTSVDKGTHHASADSQDVEPSENFGEIIKKTMVETVSA